MWTLTALLLCPPAAAIDDLWDDVPEIADGVPAGLTYLSDDQFTVQTKITVDYVYVVGAGGLSAGDRLRIEDPVFHGMTWARKSILLDSDDWGEGFNPPDCTALNLEEEQSYGLVSLVGGEEGGAAISLSRVFGRDGRAHLHAYAYTEIIVESGSLAAGEEIVVRYGDTGGGADCGHQMLDRSFREISWRTYEQIDGADWVAVEPAPTFDMVSYDEATHAHVAAPSIAVVGEPIRLKVAMLDVAGNPVPLDGATATVEATYGGASHTFRPADDGWHDFEVTLDTEGVHRVQVTAAGVTGTSNPILATASAPAERLYWGDIHTHHGHTYYDDGQRIDENHVYARDVMGYDVSAESMKGDSLPDGSSHFEIDEHTLWEELRDNCSQYTQDDVYVSLFGWEWMGEIATNYNDGHHNLYFSDCDGPLGGHDIVALGASGGVFEWVEALAASAGTETIVIPHATPYTGYNWRDRNDDIRTSAEIYSTWGHSLDLEEPDGPNAHMSVRSALVMGHRMGFIGASDNHQGWLGNPFADKIRSDGAVNASGLAAFWAPELTYAAIWQSLGQRRTYATTGHRPLMQLSAQAGGADYLPGEETGLVDSATFEWSVYGTAPLDQLTLTAVAVDESITSEKDVTQAQRDGEVIHQELPSSLDAAGSFTWEPTAGGTWAVWMTATQTDGEIAWSSPLWVNVDGPEDTGPDDTGDDTGGDDTADTAGPDDTGTPGTRCDGCFGRTAPSAALLFFAGFGALRRREG